MSLEELLMFAYEVQPFERRKMFPYGIEYVTIPDGEDGYCSNNGKVGIFYKGVLYILPLDPETLRCVKEAGLKEKSFSIPFTNWDEPEDEERCELLKSVMAQRVPWPDREDA